MEAGGDTNTWTTSLLLLYTSILPTWRCIISASAVPCSSVDSSERQQNAAMAEAMDVDAAAAAAPREIFALPLLQLIKTEQAQNGVKHSDYLRYRCCCRSADAVR